ncbi:MAG: hypothetical protein NZM43_11085 [Saprospiraceae bacterium]|nr:hypothetical protein [Saprospiraceae bacterium]MDW8484851.1 hypothetical protein [Saprospiraceae bacterium]
MIRKITVFLVSIAILWGGCEGTKDSTGRTTEIDFIFRARYDDKPLVRYQRYDYDTHWVDFFRFNAYMSNLALIRSDGGVVYLSPIEWVDFTPDDARTDTAVDVAIKLRAPEGNYVGIRLGYGVPPGLNAKQPKDFPAGHPLSRENEYWIGWKGYIFNKIEGHVYLNKDTTLRAGLVYHCGSDAVFREYTFNLPIRVEPGAPAIEITFDLKKLFYIDGKWLDLRDPYNQITSNDFNDVVIATKLMNNFRSATKVTQP